MKKMFAALLTTAALIAGPALVFTAPVAANTANYQGTIPTTCHAKAVRRVNPRNQWIPWKFRTRTGGNGVAGGKVFVRVTNRRTNKSFITSRTYRSGVVTWRFRKGLPRGRYVATAQFFTPNGSEYTNCQKSFRFRVVPRR